MKHSIVIIFIALLCVAFMPLANGQVLRGAEVVQVGNQETYNLEEGFGIYKGLVWSSVGGTVISTNAKTFSAVIQWNTAGNGSVTVRLFDGTLITLPVTVTPNCPTYTHTYPALLQSPTANSSVLSYSGNAPSGFSYFWQSTAAGTDESHAGTSFTATTEATYYLRAKDTNGCWADNAVAITAVFGSTTPIYVANTPDATSIGGTSTGVVNMPIGGEASMTEMGNYVRSYTMLEAGTNTVDFNSLNTMSKDAVAVATGYFDGLGRPAQTIQKAASPNGMDVVSFHKYDEFGREVRQYMPYVANNGTGTFKANAPTEQYGFYQNAAKVAHTDWAFAETDYEASPLNRVLATAQPGTSWVGDGRKAHTEQLVNTEADNIRIFKVDLALMETGNPTDGLIIPSPNPAKPNVIPDVVYLDGQLMIQKVTDENGNTSWSYTDKLGQNILSRSEVGDGTFADTYYVYDDFGQLRFVIPPLATQLLAENGFNPAFPNPTRPTAKQEFEDLVFYYRYDHRGRAIAKKIPGQDDEIWMIYDKLDRLILTQDGKQRNTNEWLFTIYDALSRPVATGTFRDEGVLHRTSDDKHQELRDLVSQNVSNEVFDGTDYTWQAFPFSYTQYGDFQLKLLSVTYYDNYDAVDLAKYDFRAVSEFAGNAHFEGQKNRVRGMLTATKVRRLDNDEWLWTVSHYDRKGRGIQVVADNHLGGVDAVSTLVHDFNGRTLKTHLAHQANGQTTEVAKRFVYDHAGRVLQSYYRIGAMPEALLASFEYNELGEAIKKNLGGMLGEHLQEIDYAYNIRGWLTKINDLDLATAQSDGQPKDLWAMELSYDYGFDINQFNGNIAGAKWTSARNDDVHAYGYQYDKLNRLKQADYRYEEENSGTWANAKQDFTVFGIDYDLNGNILKLNRQGAIGKDTDGNWLFGDMDRLEYSYDANRLLTVDDLASTDASAGDFMDNGSLNMTEYFYDANGSLTADNNKGLSGMTYNHLNLPTQVNTPEGLVKYGYDAAGIKLWKEVWENGTLKRRTDYVGEFVYSDNQIEFVSHEEGRFLPKETLGEFKPEFQYKDHLGNLRLSFREETAEYLVTMERNPVDRKEKEEAAFENLEATRLFSTAYARTDSASANVNGGNSLKTIGPATVITAEKGDKITFSAYAKYMNTGSFSTPSNFTLPAIGGTSTFGLESADFLGNGLGLQFNPLNALNQNSNAPNAYAVVHIMDEEGNVLETHEQFMEHGANSYQKLSLDLEVAHKDAAYAAVFVANESPTDVYFDDLELKHTRLVWQENAYYPFGMGIKPLDYEPEGSHRWKYNGKEHEEATGLIEYEWRGLDSQLGRWHGVDGMAEKYLSNSPYHFAGNNSINNIELDGNHYGIHINHESHTITIKARYNVASGIDAVEANQVAADLWNRFSGNYTTSDGIEYTVAFDLEVQQYGESDPSLANNNVEELTDAEFQASYKGKGGTEDPKDVGGVTQGKGIISNNKDKATANTRAHEIGHTLLLSDNTGGGMNHPSGNLSNTAPPSAKNAKSVVKAGIKDAKAESNKGGDARINVVTTGSYEGEGDFFKGKLRINE